MNQDSQIRNFGSKYTHDQSGQIFYAMKSPRHDRCVLVQSTCTATLTDTITSQLGSDQYFVTDSFIDGCCPALQLEKVTKHIQRPDGTTLPASYVSRYTLQDAEPRAGFGAAIATVWAIAPDHGLTIGDSIAITETSSQGLVHRLVTGTNGMVALHLVGV